MFLSTLAVSNYEISRSIGIVYGNAIRSAGILSDMFGKVTDLFGGQSKSYETELEKAQQEALMKMLKIAEQHKANAVLGINFVIASLPMSRGGLFIVSVVGTAVEIKGAI